MNNSSQSQQESQSERDLWPRDQSGAWLTFRRNYGKYVKDKVTQLIKKDGNMAKNRTRRDQILEYIEQNQHASIEEICQGILGECCNRPARSGRAGARHQSAADSRRSHGCQQPAPEAVAWSHSLDQAEEKGTSAGPLASLSGMARQSASGAARPCWRSPTTSVTAAT